MYRNASKSGMSSTSNVILACSGEVGDPDTTAGATPGRAGTGVAGAPASGEPPAAGAAVSAGPGAASTGATTRAISPSGLNRTTILTPGARCRMSSMTSATVAFL